MAFNLHWRTIAVLAGLIATSACGSAKPHPHHAAAIDSSGAAREALVEKAAADKAAADKAAARKASEEHEAANRAALDKAAADDAAAWDRTVAGIELTVEGSSAAMALDAALETLPWKAPPCLDPCPKVIKRASLGKAGELRIVSAPLYKDGPGLGLAVVFGGGARWWSTVPTELEAFECGAGHCIEKKIVDITIRRRSDHFRVTFLIRELHYLNEGGIGRHPSSWSVNVVVDCTLGSIPRCTNGSAP